MRVDRSTRALDIGSGTGAASVLLAERGAWTIASDFAIGMLRVAQNLRPPCVACDALALPFASGQFDLVVAAFCLNHLDSLACGLREAKRVTSKGGLIIASAYAEDDAHPVKDVVYGCASNLGWRQPAWQHKLRATAMPKLATIARAQAEATAADLQADVTARCVDFCDLTPADLVRWRLGMPEMASFVRTLSPDRRRQLVEAATAGINDEPPLTRSIIVVSASV